MENSSAIFEATPQNFQNDVIERSSRVPVVVLFWAEQVPQSADARVRLEGLVGQYQGKVALALVDVARDQTLAQHLRVQGLPSIRVVRDGQLVEQLEGPQDEQVLVGLLDALTLSSADVLRSQLGELLEREDFSAALALLEQAINEEPKNQSFRVELADVLVRQGALDDARQVLAGIPEDTEERERPTTRLEIAEEAAGFADRPALEAKLEQEPDDLETCYQLAVRAASEGDCEAALKQAMSILQRDRDFRDDGGRLTMLRIFTLLGKGSELAQRYRRRMFNFMH